MMIGQLCVKVSSLQGWLLRAMHTNKHTDTHTHTHIYTHTHTHTHTNTH